MGYLNEISALSGRSILVVEDEPLIALELRRVFENAGAYVFAANQLPRALQLAGHPDLSAAVLADRLRQEDTSAICSRLEQSGVLFMFYDSYEDADQVWPNALRVPNPRTHMILSKPSRECSNVLSHTRVQGPRRF
jgi:CheY-like chemotaxis protein